MNECFKRKPEKSVYLIDVEVEVLFSINLEGPISRFQAALVLPLRCMFTFVSDLLLYYVVLFF